jgi:Ca2+-binding EF-hand superfamily protein
MSRDEPKALITGNGTIDFDEFLPLMLEKMREKFEECWYKDLFRILDKKNKGYIPCEYLR